MAAVRNIIPAALALRDFRAPGPAPEEPRAEADASAPAPAGSPRPAPDMRRLLRAAYLTGRRKEARAAQARLQQALKTLEEQHARRLQEERARWQREIAAKLATQLGEGLAALEERLRATLAGVLSPLLEEAACARALEAFCRELRAHLAQAQDAVIEVSGPPAMLEALHANLGEEMAALVRFSPAPDAGELSARIDEAALATCVAEWARKHLPEGGA